MLFATSLTGRGRASTVAWLTWVIVSTIQTVAGTLGTRPLLKEA